LTVIVLIPAYEPGGTLSQLVRELRASESVPQVVVVDDGSGAAYAGEFDAARRAGASVLSYPVNRGKGFALRTGVAHILEHFPGEVVVCADSDGQHRVADILRVARRAEESDGAIVLGGRRFVGDVPVRSRLGNSVSRLAFRAVAGVRVHDTQTGLRGYPRHLLAWMLSIAGDRFEYELNLLLDAAATGIPMIEVEVATVYLRNNAASHFRPIVDSVRVLRPLMAFGASSFGAFLLDLAALQVIFALTGSLLIAVVGARVVSGTVNFLVNRYLVFRSRSTPVRSHALRYLALALAIVTASYVMLGALTALGMALVPAKIVTDVTLYVLSFQVQRLVIFARRTSAPARRNRELVLSSRRR
jgi:glycosyltransferase involved in cell wall biosynthesis